MTSSKSLFDNMISIEWGRLWERLNSSESYEVECDDRCGIMRVLISSDGDLHLSMSPSHNTTLGVPTFRARTSVGGGNHLRVRKALMLLALAIKEDIEGE